MAQAMPIAGPVAGWAFSIVLLGAVSIDTATVTGRTGMTVADGGTGRRLSAQPIAAAPAASAAASAASQPGWVCAQPSGPVAAGWGGGVSAGGGPLAGEALAGAALAASGAALDAGETLPLQCIRGGARTGHPAPNAAAAGSAWLQLPNGTSYVPVNASVFDTYTEKVPCGNAGATDERTRYQAFADVTSLVQAGGGGSYTVGNVQAGTGATGVYLNKKATVALVTGTVDDSITLFTIKDRQLTQTSQIKLEAKAAPRDVIIAPDGKTAYALRFGDGKVLKKGAYYAKLPRGCMVVYSEDGWLYDVVW